MYAILFSCIRALVAGTGVDGGDGSPTASYVRYVKDITLHINLEDGTKDGKIRIPYFTVRYGEVSRESADTGATVQVLRVFYFILFYFKFNFI